MKRLGLSLVGNHKCNELLRYTSLAESYGYDSVWVPEDLGMRDAVAPLAYLATLTKRIKLATGILPIYYRPPAVTAMTFATLDEISNGRMILALGHALLEWLAQQGIQIKKPAQAMKEYTQILRKLWTGESVKYDGGFFKLDDVKLAFDFPRPRIPVYFAARGPKMFQLAGEVADGVLNCEGFVAPEYFEWVKNNLAVGAEKASRKLSEVDLAAYVFLSVSNEHEKAKEKMKPSVLSILAQGALTPHLERFGSSMAQVAPAIKAWNMGDKRGACKLLPDKILQAASIYGTPSECERQLKEFREAGVNLPIILPVGDWTESVQLAKDW